ncbi:MAG: CotH kinase family protein [Actinomycetales bacterium]|nr:CotH kinase family protein [Actinomycetales bacterium]
MTPSMVQASSSSPVVINEVRCSGSSPAFIELFNTSSTVRIDLTGWVLGDHLGNLSDTYHVWNFKTGTTIGPRMYFRIFRGIKTTEFKFDITCGDDSIKLAQVVGTNTNIIDSVAVPPLVDGFTWGRMATARLGWTATLPTPYAANKAPTSGTVVDKSAWVFDPLLVKRIDLNLPQQTLDYFQNGNPGDLYRAGTFAITAKNAAGNTVKTISPMQVGIRLKNGFGSYRPFGNMNNPSKSSFKIKFNNSVQGQRLDGLAKLTLNNMVQDPTLVHEWASYTLLRAMGIPAPRVGYSSVYINNKLWGFYLTLEPYDDVSLSWTFPKTQHLYEALWTDRPPDINTGRTNFAYEVDEGDKTNRSDLQALENAVNNNAMSSAQVQSVLNVQAMVNMMAVEQYLDHWDGYTSTRWWTPNNYYLHSNEAGYFELLPWGTDQTFSGNTGNLADATGLLFKRCYSDDYCRSLYHIALAKVSATASSLALPAGASQILTAQQQGISDDQLRGMTYNDTVSAANGIGTHITTANAQVANYLRNNTTGAIRWNPTLTLKAGTKLTPAILNAYSDTAGTFTYSPALNTITRVGSLKVTATFKPTNTANYSTKTLAVTFKIIP